MWSGIPEATCVLRQVQSNCRKSGAHIGHELECHVVLRLLLHLLGGDVHDLVLGHQVDTKRLVQVCIQSIVFLSSAVPDVSNVPTCQLLS